MKKLLKNILLWAGLTALGVVSANCSPERPIVPSRLELKVNDEYVLTLPENVTITDVDNKFASFDKNELMINPWHVYNGDINIKTHEQIMNSYSFDEDYKINLDVDPIVYRNIEYVYFRPVNENSVLGCDRSETQECPYEINDFAYLDSKYIGIKKSVKYLEDITKSKPASENIPVIIHLNASPPGSHLDDPNVVTTDFWNLNKIVGISRKNHIYVFASEWAKNPNWPALCMNLVIPTQMPTEPTETCQCVGDNASNVPCTLILSDTQDYFKNPEELNDQNFIVHEYNHTLASWLLPNLVKGSTKHYINEGMSYSLGTLISKVGWDWKYYNYFWQGPIFKNQESTSFYNLDLSWITNIGYSSPEFWKEMCNSTGFDLNTLDKFYEFGWKAYEKRKELNGIFSTFPEDVKCALDYATGIDTYNTFCKDSECNQIIFPNGSKSYFYVPDEFCGYL